MNNMERILENEQVSTPEDVAPTENTATEREEYQADVCDNSIDDEDDNVADFLDPEGCISDGGSSNTNRGRRNAIRRGGYSFSTTS